MSNKTIHKWTAKCTACGNPISGRDVIEPGQPLDRRHEHDNPNDMYLDIPGTGGAHSSWPDDDTIQITETHEW